MLSVVVEVAGVAFSGFVVFVTTDDCFFDFFGVVVGFGVVVVSDNISFDGGVNNAPVEDVVVSFAVTSGADVESSRSSSRSDVNS